MQSLLSPHMFEGGAVHDGEASLANHLGARPVHVAALVVAAKEVVVGRHLEGHEQTAKSGSADGGLVSLPQFIWMSYRESQVNSDQVFKS